MPIKIHTVHKIQNYIKIYLLSVVDAQNKICLTFKSDCAIMAEGNLKSSTWEAPNCKAFQSWLRAPQLPSPASACCCPDLGPHSTPCTGHTSIVLPQDLALTGHAPGELCTTAHCSGRLRERGGPSGQQPAPCIDGDESAIDSDTEEASSEQPLCVRTALMYMRVSPRPREISLCALSQLRPGRAVSLVFIKQPL